MSVQLIEGFERGSIDVIGDNSGSIIGFDRAVATSGGTAGFWSRFYWAPSVSNAYIPLKDSSGTHFYGAFRIYPTNFNRSILGIAGTDLGRHFYLLIDSTGHLVIRDANDVQQGVSTAVLYQNAWNLVEFDVTIGNSAAANCYLHGVSAAEIALTTKDFQSTTAAGAVLWTAGNTGNYLDDIIVYDSSGTKWNSRVGDKVVWGGMPNAKGDQEQWDPKKIGTVQRFYFPKALRTQTSGGTNKDGYPAPVGVTPSASWEYITAVETDAVPRGRLTPETTGYSTTQPTTGLTDSRPAYDVSGSPPFDLLGAQYISPALAAQTISGTLKMQMLVAEETANDDIASQLIIRVVSNDGQTVRGTLYAGDTDATDPPSSEWSTSAINRKFPRAALSPITLSSLAISEGDRLVIEFGGRMRGAARTSVLISFNTGVTSGTTTDLPEDETDTTSTKLPWIEFSSALTLSDDGNWDHVAELMPDDDGTYVTTNVDNDLDLYHVEAFPSSLAVSGPLVIQTRAKKVDPGTRTLTHALKTSGATQTSSALGLPTGAYGCQRSYYDTDPTDSADWSDTKVNGIQIGPKATT